MASIANLRSGQIVYAVSRERMGNTTLRTTRVETIKVLSTDDALGRVEAVRYGEVKRYYRRSVSAWRTNKPYLLQMGMCTRLAKPAEVRAALDIGIVPTEHIACFMIRAETVPGGTLSYGSPKEKDPGQGIDSPE